MRPKLFFNLVMYVWRDLYKIILVTIKHFDLYQKIKVMQYHATSYISYFDLDSYLTCILLYELLHADTGTPLYGPSYVLFVISFTLNFVK